MQNEGDFLKKINPIYRALIVLCALLIIKAISVIYFKSPTETMEADLDAQKTTEQPNSNPDLIENGIHLRSGLLASDGLMDVVNNCTTCHSAKLVTQNRMDRAQWEATIRWMQETQGLWDLGDKQEVIINYLTTNYPPLQKGRRQALSNIDWYTLEQ